MGLLDIVKRIWSGGPWVDLVADPGNRPELTIRTFHALRRRGVRARYRVLGTGGGPGAPVGSVAQTIKIEVHRDDLHDAQRIFDELRR